MVKIKWECELLYEPGGAKSQAGTRKAEPAPPENKKTKAAMPPQASRQATQNSNSIALQHTIQTFNMLQKKQIADLCIYISVLVLHIMQKNTKQ